MSIYEGSNFVLCGQQICYNNVMKKMPRGSGIGIGIAVGVALGVALGNIGIGIAMGIILGVVFDASHSKKQ
jgi:hypothetical protein